MDNGTQFDSEAFRDFCDQIGTKIHFASVRHPESNGLVERANGIIMTGIMKLIFLYHHHGGYDTDVADIPVQHSACASSVQYEDDFSGFHDAGLCGSI